MTSINGRSRIWLPNAVTLIYLISLARVATSAYGYLTPNGRIYVQEGDPLTLTCTLNSYNSTFNSKDIEFQSATEKYSPANVTIIDEATAVLHLTNLQAGTLLITCTCQGRGVKYVDVNIGTKPKEVEDFKCISNNFKKLNCTFKFAENSVPVTYTLNYYRGSYGFVKTLTLTPYVNETFPDFWFNVWYTPAFEKYTFELNMTNALGSVKQTFVVNNVASMRPDPPEKVHAIQREGSPVNLTWAISMDLATYDEYGKIIANITCQSRYDKRPPFRILDMPNKTDWSVLLHNLTAFTDYTVKIRLRGTKSPDSREDLWSDVTEYKFRTLSRIPDQPPHTDMGSFWASEKNDVLIYWKTLEEYEYNAPNAKYHIRQVLPTRGREYTVWANETKLRLPNAGVHTSQYEIHSVNDKGRSRNYSVITVPGPRERLGKPTNLKKTHNATDNVYKLTWTPDPKDAARVTGYTVFWCKSKSESANPCEGSIQIAKLPASQLEYSLSTKDYINLAVSANSETTSSGMVWAECTARDSRDIGKLKTIWISDMTPRSMELKWHLDCADRPITHSYNLTYCPIVSPKNVSCREDTQKYEIFDGHFTSYNITGLKPYTTYKTYFVLMTADHHSGPESDHLLNTTYEATLSQPRNLKYANVTNTSVVLQWDSPFPTNGVINKYQIFYNEKRLDVMGDFQNNETVTRVLGDLDGYTHYKIVVKACSNCCGCSDKSNSVNITTEIGRPGVVETQQTNNEPQKKVVFTWAPPTNKAGVVDFYEVMVRNDKENATTYARMQFPGCTLYLGHQADSLEVEAEVQWSVQVRAVNAIWSPHAAFNTTERRSGDVQDANNSCLEEDAFVQYLMSNDKYVQVLPGKWSNTYTHLTGGQGAFRWKSTVAITVFTGLLVCTAVYVYKKFFRLKKGTVVLPPGLTDIVAKPEGKGGDGGGLGGPGGNGGLLDHGNGTVIGRTDAMGHMDDRMRHSSIDKLYECKGSGMGGGGSAQLTYEDRQNGGALGAMMVHMDTSSLHEQEQSLLGDRVDARSSASTSSSSSSLAESEDGGMLDVDEMEDLEPQKQQPPQQRLGLPPGLRNDIILPVPLMQNPLPKMMFPPMHQPTTLPPQTVIKPAANGYVTIAPQSNGYTKLGDLMKPMHMGGAVTGGVGEDRGITGYVTHKQLADFGQRMQ